MDLSLCPQEDPVNGEKIVDGSISADFCSLDIHLGFQAYGTPNSNTTK